MNNENLKSLNMFRWVAIAEGWSFIILLFVAMPLKYIFGWPLAVKVVGWAHGLLFAAYFILLIQVAIALSWGFIRVVIAGLVSFIPFGTFWLDKKLKKEYEL